VTINTTINTRRDDTKGGYSKDKTRQHLQGEEKATTIETVSPPSPIRGGIEVLTVLKAKHSDT
jgi:hypothetical protein